MTQPTGLSRSNGACHLFIIGMGNIGSHLVPYLARTPGIGKLTLCDFDSYDQGNLGGQDICARHVSCAKVDVQAQRVQQINPRLRVEVVKERIERVPWGLLRADLILCCVDNRAARQYLNAVAFHLGVPWVDAAVEARGLMARISVFRPDSDSSCLECTWSLEDYRLLEQSQPCQSSDAPTPATNAPASLGGLAAALQAIEAQKLMQGQFDQKGIGWQILLSAQPHNLLRSQILRNPHCRFTHDIWHIQPLLGPCECLREALAKIGLGDNGRQTTWVGVAGQQWVARLSCPSCRFERRLFHLRDRLSRRKEVCPQCRIPLAAAGMDMTERIRVGDVPAPALDMPMADLGIQKGDILAITTPHGEKRFDLRNTPE